MARCPVTDLDAGVPQEMSGRDLMQQGLTVEIESRPGAAVIIYQKAKQPGKTGG